MATYDSAHQSRSSRRRRCSNHVKKEEIEGGEFHGIKEEGRPQIKRERVTIAVGAQSSPYCHECRVCGKGFTSTNAVSGHMRIHKERPPVVPAIGGGMAIVVAEPVINAMAGAFQSRRSRHAEPNPPTNGHSMAIVVAAANAPDQKNQIVAVHPPSSPQFNQGQLAAAPPQFLHLVAQGQVHRAAPLARDEFGWWLCKEEGCDQRFSTHHGLGGHMAGHKRRRLNVATAAAGFHLGVASGGPPTLHQRMEYPREFTSGVQLGGHYPDKKRRGAGADARPRESAAELASLLSLSPTIPPTAMEAPSGVVRIFGVNIVPAAGPPAAAAAVEEVSSAVTMNNVQH